MLVKTLTTRNCKFRTSLQFSPCTRRIPLLLVCTAPSYTYLRGLWSTDPKLPPFPNTVETLPFWNNHCYCCYYYCCCCFRYYYYSTFWRDGMPGNSVRNRKEGSDRDRRQKKYKYSENLKAIIFLCVALNSHYCRSSS